MALKTFDKEFWKQIEVVGMTYIEFISICWKRECVNSGWGTLKPCVLDQSKNKTNKNNYNAVLLPLITEAHLKSLIPKIKYFMSHRLSVSTTFDPVLCTSHHLCNPVCAFSVHIFSKYGESLTLVATCVLLVRHCGEKINQRSIVWALECGPSF